MKGLQVNQHAIQRNLETYAPFAAVERVLMALSKAGADRQVMHEHLRGHSLAAWSSIQSGNPNPLSELICQDPVLAEYIPESELFQLMEISQYLGDAPQRARQMAGTIKDNLAA